MIVRTGNGLKCVNDLVGVNGSVGCVCKGVGEQKLSAKMSIYLD